MNGRKFSIKEQLFSRITRLGWFWIVILYVCTVLFYAEFFQWLPSILLAVYITIILVSMMLVGYLRLGPNKRFPIWHFILWTLLFSLLRYAYIYFFLHEHMPNYTVFHNVKRVVPTVVFTSASLLFLGYSYAIYEWGLAAREKYRSESAKVQQDFVQPIVIRSDGANVYLLPQDITHISANGEYVDYHTVQKRYTVFKRLKQVEKEMKSLGFLRCHRSHIVNVDKVVAVSTSEITISDDLVLPLSKTYKDSFHTKKDPS